MNGERTLGDILGEALALVGGDYADEPRLDRLGDGLAAFVEARDRELAERAQYLAARELARQIAPLLGVTAEQAFEALTYVPDEMLPLLQSPEGWSALAAMVASRVGVLTATFVPTRH